jgi:hypothetical protein
MTRGRARIIITIPERHRQRRCKSQRQILRVRQRLLQIALPKTGLLTPGQKEAQQQAAHESGRDSRGEVAAGAVLSFVKDLLRIVPDDVRGVMRKCACRLDCFADLFGQAFYCLNLMVCIHDVCSVTRAPGGRRMPPSLPGEALVVENGKGRAFREKCWRWKWKEASLSGKVLAVVRHNLRRYRHG